MHPTEEIIDLINRSLQSFQTIPEEAWSAKKSPTVWSKRELLGHLIDSAMNNLRRFVVSQYEPAPHVVYDQEAWVALQDYQHADTQELILLWQLLNQQLVRTVNRISDEQMLLTCNTSKEGAPELRTLHYLVEDYVVHLKHHLQQLAHR
ncbi:DinB superfamily protein [Catalinimonas alkaloidigena]|uniref:DinB superfamily protein n=1 Tax=Catalinimonas alkaloidigena TaxID=1075417 RepID=A0A1G9BCX0_9BACT|nr:DinB family protein [Catalinimonas alkaloidigena]SDK36705.1 DinB superfamily protein [Catalinimonas alkaloidigena]